MNREDFVGIMRTDLKKLWKEEFKKSPDLRKKLGTENNFEAMMINSWIKGE